MRRLLCMLLLLLALPVAPHSDAGPVLNVLPVIGPWPAQLGQPLTIAVGVYSTAEISETVHVELTTAPWFPLAIGGAAFDTALGPGDCQPTLIRLICDVPIRRWSPVTIWAQIDMPPAGAYLWPAPCAPQIRVLAAAQLIGRASEADIPVPVAVPPCVYLPEVRHGA